MLILILFLVAGSILAYISQNNLTLVSVNLGPYIFSNIPLFYVIIASVVTGLVLSYVIHLFYAVTSSMRMRRKNKKIKEYKDEVLELTKRVHQLELDNEKLKHEPSIEPEDPNAL